MNKIKMDLKYREGITLISLVITIIILLILAGITIAQLKENGLLSKTKEAAQESKKSDATEKMNLKITEIQIDSYAKNEKMPNLQYLADKLCEDNEIDYVLLQSKSVASIEKIDVGNSKSIFTKLKEYPFEFEINSSLQLASIDGIKVADKSDIANSTLVGKPNITLSEVESKKITVNADIGNSNKTDIAAYVFFNADTAEIVKIEQNLENLIVDNLNNNTKYNIYMKILDKYGNFSEMSNILSFTTKNFGILNVKYVRGYSYNTYGDITNSVKQYLFDGIKTKQGSYGAYMMGTQQSSYMTFDIENGDMYITFSSNSYSDSGGSSGKEVNFYKLNSNNEYELYTSFTQQNNNYEYSKTFFEEGSYKMTFSGNYVEFDEWIISEN